MSTETNKPVSFVKEHLQDRKVLLREKVNDFNKMFNSLSIQIKKVCLILFGISTASICIVLILRALAGEANSSLRIDQIALPDNIHMNKPATQQLTPIGKMKGEIDGEFEAFYLAVDQEGQLFMNRAPEFSKDSLDKSKGWEPLTRQQLEAYEKKLHFIPAPKRGLNKGLKR